MERMEEELTALKQRQKEEQGKQQDSGKNVAEALMFLEENELTEDMKDKLIEKVLVHEEGGLRWFGSSGIMWRW